MSPYCELRQHSCNPLCILSIHYTVRQLECADATQVCRQSELSHHNCISGCVNTVVVPESHAQGDNSSHRSNKGVSTFSQNSLSNHSRCLESSFVRNTNPDNLATYLPKRNDPSEVVYLWHMICVIGQKGSAHATPLLLFDPDLTARKNAMFQATTHGTGSDVAMLFK